MGSYNPKYRSTYNLLLGTLGPSKHSYNGGYKYHEPLRGLSALGFNC